MLKSFKTVISPVKHWYLTKGKEYEARDLQFFTDNGGMENVRFAITADDEIEECCVLKQDGHLKGKDWIIKE